MKKLLIVDDEPEIVEFLRSYFAERGEFKILTATSQEEAIDLINREKPHIILLDLRMRGDKTGGFQVLIKTREISPQSKVIMVTAVEDRASIEEALKLGAVDYITKPLSLEYLESTVIEKLKEVSGS